MDEELIFKIVFRVGIGGFYEYFCMFFGLCNSLVIF